MHALRFL